MGKESDVPEWEGLNQTAQSQRRPIAEYLDRTDSALFGVSTTY